MTENAPNRRRFPRFKLSPQLRIKARIKSMGNSATHYFSVQNLSMGGISLVSEKGAAIELNRGDTLEILITGGDLSLRCVAKVAQSTLVPMTEAEAREKLRCIQAGVEIVGI